MAKISSFPLLLLRAEIWLSASLLPFVLPFRNFSQMLEDADVDVSHRYAGLSTSLIANTLIKTTRHPWLMRDRRCLRQGLIGYRYLRKAGYQPELHFGVEANSLDEEVINAHCWVVVEGKPVISEKLPDMETVHIHPANSQM
jgi:hypothetical protein